MTDGIFDHPERADVFSVPPEHLSELAERATKAKLELLGVDLAGSSTLAELLEQLGRSCQFPDWYGANLDALNDCLCDPNWHHTHGQALCLTNLDTFRHRRPAEYAALLDVLQAAIQTRATSSHPLWVLVTTRDDKHPAVLSDT